MNQSDLEYMAQQQIERAGIDNWTAEYRFSTTRRFRADFALHDLKILIECHGGTWSRGRHVRGKGFQNDCVKNNLAVVLGYRILAYTREMLESGALYADLELLRRKGSECD